MKRKDFLKLSSLSIPAFLLKEQPQMWPAGSKSSSIKPITGSWFEFQHHLEEEGKYWDPALKNFTEQQWKEKVKEIKEIGMEYLILMSVAAYDNAYYPTRLAKQLDMGCADPLEAVLSAADEAGVKFYISNDYWGDVRNPKKLMYDPAVNKIREAAMLEITKKYSHHPSFYGWYFPNEMFLSPYFDEAFITYVNHCAEVAKSLTPHCKTLIAPYGIVKEKLDDTFIRQLERLNVDSIAYQDGVGVKHTKLMEAGGHFRHLAAAHQKASRAAIWADMELFYFEDETHGNLLPADFQNRILKQMEDISPYVERILCYQYIGMMNKPGSKAYAGSDHSAKLYEDYKQWLDGKK